MTSFQELTFLGQSSEDGAINCSFYFSWNNTFCCHCCYDRYSVLFVIIDETLDILLSLNNPLSIFGLSYHILFHLSKQSSNINIEAIWFHFIFIVLLVLVKPCLWINLKIVDGASTWWIFFSRSRKEQLPSTNPITHNSWWSSRRTSIYRHRILKETADIISTINGHVQTISYFFAIQLRSFGQWNHRTERSYAHTTKRSLGQWNYRIQRVTATAQETKRTTAAVRETIIVPTVEPAINTNQDEEIPFLLFILTITNLHNLFRELSWH